MKIVLMGYMGSGKSSVGKILADGFGLPFKDLDTEIEVREQMSIPELFKRKGEIYFRKAENKTLKTLLAMPGEFVLATGGGTPCYADSLAAILEAGDVLSVYLKTPLPLLCDRLMQDKERRPLLAHLQTKEAMLEFVGIHLFERAHFYNQAGLVVETDAHSPEEIARKITGLL